MHRSFPWKLVEEVGMISSKRPCPSAGHADPKALRCALIRIEQQLDQ